MKYSREVSKDIWAVYSPIGKISMYYQLVPEGWRSKGKTMWTIRILRPNKTLHSSWAHGTYNGVKKSLLAQLKFQEKYKGWTFQRDINFVRYSITGLEEGIKKERKDNFGGVF